MMWYDDVGQGKKEAIDEMTDEELQWAMENFAPTLWASEKLEAIRELLTRWDGGQFSSISGFMAELRATVGS